MFARHDQRRGANGRGRLGRPASAARSRWPTASELDRRRAGARRRRPAELLPDPGRRRVRVPALLRQPTPNGCARASCSCSRTRAAKPELIDDGALTFVVVGGGPTGVETAGALAELVHDVMPHGTRSCRRRRPGDPGRPRPRAARAVLRRGARLRGEATAAAGGRAAARASRCKEVAEDHVKLSDGTTIRTHLVVWGGGEMAAAVAGAVRPGAGPGWAARRSARPDGARLPERVRGRRRRQHPVRRRAGPAAARQRRPAVGRLGRAEHPRRHASDVRRRRSTTGTRASWP